MSCVNHHRAGGTPMPPEAVLTKIATKVWGGYKKVADNSRPKGIPILGAGCQMVVGKRGIHRETKIQ